MVAPALLDERRAGPPPWPRGGASVAAPGHPGRRRLGGAPSTTYDFEPAAGRVGRACRLSRGRADAVLVVGDSHAGDAPPDARAASPSATTRALRRLPPLLPVDAGIRYTMASGRRLLRPSRRRLFDRRVPALDPDIVVLVHRRRRPGPRMPMVDREGRSPGPRAVRPRWSQRPRDGADLRGDGRTVVFLEPIPVPPPAPTRSPASRRPSASRRAASWPAAGPTARGAVPRRARRRRRRHRGASTSTGPWCPYLPICDPVVGTGR